MKKFSNFPQVFKCAFYFHKIFGFLPLTITYESHILKWKTTFLDCVGSVTSIAFFVYACHVNVSANTFVERIDNKITTTGFLVLRMLMLLDATCRPFLCFVHRIRLACILKNICVADKKVFLFSFNYIYAKFKFLFDIVGSSWD